MTSIEMQQRCLEQLGVRIGNTAPWHQFDRLGLSYKKHDARRKQDRLTSSAARRWWRCQQLGGT
jgi:hypothetical protein